MTLKSKLADEHPLIVLPHLAAEVDLIRHCPTADSLLVNQRRIRRIIEGMRWLYNTYNKWQEQLSLLG